MALRKPASKVADQAPEPDRVALLARIATHLGAGAAPDFDTVLEEVRLWFRADGAVLYARHGPDGESLVRLGCAGAAADVPPALHSSASQPGDLNIPLGPGGPTVGSLTVVRPGSAAAMADDVLIAALGGSIGQAVRADRLAALLRAHEGLHRELEVAAEIQRGLLPSNESNSPLFGLNRPAYQVSGDFFDFFQLPGGRVPFTLGDVSGKGIKAALLMAKTVSLFRCLAKSVPDPTRLIHRINNEIYETVTHGMFVTMVAGIYDPGTGEVQIANAGHEPPLLRSADRSYRMFPADTPPVGIMPELWPKTTTVSLDGGEFYIFTDGLTEFRSDDTGEELGSDGLVHMLESMPGDSQRQRLTALLADLDRDGEWRARDDLTVLGIDDSRAYGQMQ